MDLGCEVKPASNASDTGSAAWWWRVVWKELCHVQSHPYVWVWCWIGSGGWVWFGLVGDRVGWATAGVGSGGAAGGGVDGWSR